jgi:hypothetical protein
VVQAFRLPFFNRRPAACRITMIAFVKPPKKPTRSPAVERARHLLTTKLLPPEPDEARKAARIAAWKALAFGTILIVIAICCGFLLAAMF